VRIAVALAMTEIGLVLRDTAIQPGEHVVHDIGIRVSLTVIAAVVCGQ
jgi:hypothetical protein